MIRTLSFCRKGKKRGQIYFLASRYECGETMQSKALDQLLRTLQEHANILDEIKAREDQAA